MQVVSLLEILIWVSAN